MSKSDREQFECRISECLRDATSDESSVADALKDRENEQSVGYIPQYPHLLKLAQKIEDDELMMLALAVYGWMPTILKKWQEKAFSKETRFASRAREVTSLGEALGFLETLETAAPINNSWVGTSKVLHMLAPSVFPIFDSKIANRIAGKDKITAPWVTKARYIAYLQACHAVVGKEQGKIEALRELVNGGKVRDWTDIRMLEFVLFVGGKPKGTTPD